jgi:hypothetical protein
MSKVKWRLLRDEAGEVSDFDTPGFSRTAEFRGYGHDEVLALVRLAEREERERVEADLNAHAFLAYVQSTKCGARSGFCDEALVQATMSLAMEFIRLQLTGAPYGRVSGEPGSERRGE